MYFYEVKIIKTYKFKLRPNRLERNTFSSWLGTCRFLYNLSLEHRITAYQSAGKSVNYYDQANELKAIKRTIGFEWISNVQSQILQDVLKRVETSFKNFFRGSGFPKWAKKDQYNSFTYPQISNFQVERSKIKLPKMGWVKFYHHRKIEGAPKQIKIVKELNNASCGATTANEIMKN